LIPVQITVKRGKCQDNIHQIGQVFIVKDTTPEGICKDAWIAIAPYVMTLQCGGDFAWAEKGTAIIHCPDPKGITLELRRIEK
jgi:uncharacterized repeat protein (TIGR04076 family)